MAKVAKEVEAIELNLNEEIKICLNDRGKIIYKEYYKKYRHKPIKKAKNGWYRVALFEFMYIFGSKMFMGAEAVTVGNKIRIPIKLSRGSNYWTNR